MEPDDERSQAPHIPLPTQTLVMEGNAQLLSIDGLLILPIGARINLDDVRSGPSLRLPVERFPHGHADAIVVGVRLWGALSAGRVLVLEVELVGPHEQQLPML